MNALIHLLNEYGYIVLFFSLMLELIIIPIPNEALMSYVGVLAFQGKMNLILSILVAGLGGIIGASISYWIGYKLGGPFFKKYGRYIHMGPEKMEKMEHWYSKYGKVLLVVSYIIPGIRHVASIISGVIKLPFRSFAVFSYIGVFLWAGTFIFLGYSLGPKWDKYQGEIKKWLVLASIIAGIAVLAYIVIKANRQFIKESMKLIFHATFKRYKSFVKVKILLLFMLILFAALFALMIGMIQDFIANEFGHFNIVFRTLVYSIFTPGWSGIISIVYAIASVKVLSVLAVLTVLIVLLNRKNIWLELLFFAITLIGTLLFSTGIHWLFRFLFSNKQISSHFPDQPAMFIVSIGGFLLYTLFRHRRNYHAITILLVLFLGVLAAYSVSVVSIQTAEPSDIMAGYVFSGAWTSGMFFALEIFRFLSLLKKEQNGQESN
ncbi:VTT domain-containing protein [Heyndrickxia acidicola]|uniref:VTT domain-containing protein n=1 Tax=Heyndrickxia acidicola TaxID=209389 RepID=A0ABU6MFM4_9BACI|nr:VTT domain-containing protein [Heyndrickxia acidicola]MED1203471.1 VTT domain-containing protein [Heyndrickxia acidicola]